MSLGIFEFFISFALSCYRDTGVLLLEHRESLLNSDDSDIQRITGCGKHIFHDTIQTLKRSPWNPSQHLKVTFIGEPGVDDGGPTREFFRLLLTDIGRQEMLFEGPDGKRLPRHNSLVTSDKLFFYIGQIMALSMLNFGPCVQWLAPTIVHYMLGDDSSYFLDDIPDKDVLDKVMRVRIVATLTCKLRLVLKPNKPPICLDLVTLIGHAFHFSCLNSCLNVEFCAQI